VIDYHFYKPVFIFLSGEAMPTKHIDDATAAQLDDLYVRCVTLTQQPVKEVEVLRLAIQKGIHNIADDDILATLSVKDSVWEQLAAQTWSEVAAWWPEEAISADRFELLAEEHSATWQQYPTESCRTALRERLSRKLKLPIFGTSDVLFEGDDFGMAEEERQAAILRERQQDAAYRAELPALHGRQYSSLSQHEQTLARHYDDRVSFTPDGKGILWFRYR
jgi:hypothetical protein